VRDLKINLFGRQRRNQPAAIATIASFTNQLIAYEATNTRCSFMNAAFVRISGKGPINHTARASVSAPATE
jgi:hypothetical protein